MVAVLGGCSDASCECFAAVKMWMSLGGTKRMSASDPLRTSQFVIEILMIGSQRSNAISCFPEEQTIEFHRDPAGRELARERKDLWEQARDDNRRLALHPFVAGARHGCSRHLRQMLVKDCPTSSRPLFERGIRGPRAQSRDAYAATFELARKTFREGYNVRLARVVGGHARSGGLVADQGSRGSGFVPSGAPAFPEERAA